MKSFIAAMLIAITFALLAHAVEYLDEQEVEEALMRDYCAQVETYYGTDGEYGWPDYKRVYSTQCNVSN